MKEIGKLIELLNEYLSPFSGYIHYHNGKGFKRTPTKSAAEGDRMLQDEYVLGKSFGFVKWLVENDKIDIKALVVKGEMRSGWDFDNKKGNEESGEEIWNKYYSELCLMILAIQDEPIRFLCSILK